MPDEALAGGLGAEPNRTWPKAGWKFQISYSGWRSLPGVRQRKSYFCDGETLDWPPAEEQRETLSYVPKTKVAEREALSAPFEVAPGEQKTVVREFNWTGPAEEELSEESVTYVDHLTLTISVDAKGDGKGNGRSSKGGGGGKSESKRKARGEGGSSSASKRLVSERTKEKEEAEARLGGDTIWAAAADAAAKAGGGIGLVGSLLAPTAQKTLAKDEKTVKDPPLGNVWSIARPLATTAKALSCAGVYPASSSSCKSFESAERSLSHASSKIAAIAAAQYTTISRQSGAIDSGKSSAAEAQAKHFAALETERRKELRAQAAAGGEVASLLGKAGVGGSLSTEQMAAGAETLEAALRKQGLSSAEIGSLPLEAKAADFLKLLAHGV